MLILSAGQHCDATFAGMAACHCSRCHLSFADRPAYDAHRVIMRPCLHPAVLGMEPLDVFVQVGTVPVR